METGICPLFDIKTELCGSHIFPKFAYKDLKWNNQSRFVTWEKECPPMQYGYKVPLLGRKAENLFSKYENWFAQHIYRPFRNGELKGTVSYNENLYFFAVLQTWRGCLYATKHYGKDKFADGLYDSLISAMGEWKNYLVNGVLPPEHNAFYLMPLGKEHVRLPLFLEVEFYMRRIFEFNIMMTDVGNAVYCKLPSFIIWAPLSRQSQIDYGFKIMPDGGTFIFSNYVITDSEVIDYLLYKIDKTVKWRKHLALTNPQKIKDSQAKMAADKEFQKSELAEILSKPSLSEMQLSGAEFTMSFIY